jgi:transcriptional regulator with XRE-family HTH domain
MHQILKTLRKQAGMTQAQLAEASGLNRVTIARYELGTIVPNFDSAVKLAKALGVTLEQLAGEEAKTSA